MHIHILGICGTFMAGLAALAKELGHTVTGSDENIYPPMSTQLAALGIQLHHGYDPIHLNPTPDVVVIGNVMKRGNPCVEYILKYNLRYISGPQWLYENVLQSRWVLTVTGTHGKTTTSSILAWILEYAGIKPGFLIGGIPRNFNLSARLGNSNFFVIEGDEYDSAFFEKFSKFLHYRTTRTLIVNNLEFDHADIFANLDAIQTQFANLLRIIPGNGLIIPHANEPAIQEVLAKGCWSPIETFSHYNGNWQAANINHDFSRFDIIYNNKNYGRVEWPLIGKHNMENALAAVAAAQHAGVPIEKSVPALSLFSGVKRRLEIKGQIKGVTVYDDFAHHPTAISKTIQALRSKIETGRIIAVIELGSYTMRYGCHGEQIIDALENADYILILRPKEAAQWNLDEIVSALNKPAKIYDTVSQIVNDIASQVGLSDHVLVMSNKSFDGIHEKILKKLQKTRMAEVASPFFVA